MILEEESERKTLLISLADSSVPSPSASFSSKNVEKDLLFHPSSKPGSLFPSPSLLCRFRMPIKLTSCLVNDRHGHRGKSNSGLIRCKVAKRTSFRYRKRKDLFFGPRVRRDRSMRIGLLGILSTKTRYNLTGLTKWNLCYVFLFAIIGY